MDDGEDGGTWRWTMDGERAIWEEGCRAARETKLCVARLSSFNQNYKGVPVEKQMELQLVEEWMEGWRSGTDDLISIL